MQGESFASFTGDGAWCFFADPRAVRYAGRHDRTYVGWLTKQGDVMIGAYDHKDGSVDSAMVKPRLQQDDHANPSLYFPEDGQAIIFYSAHNGKTMYYRKMEAPEDISSFGEERELPENTSGMHGYTYPNLVYAGRERKLYLFWRGGNFKPNFSTCQDGSDAWSEPQTLIYGDGARPYIKYAGGWDACRVRLPQCDGLQQRDELQGRAKLPERGAALDGGIRRDAIWFAFTDGHPNIEPHNSIYCAYIRNGAVYRADGTAVKPVSGLPMLPREADVVFDGAEHGTKAWIWDIALDANGHPVLVYTVFRSDTDHRYWYSRWNGEAWESREITAGGSWFPQTEPGAVEREPFYSGGIILDHADPANVYLSRPVNGVFEIEHWRTSDHGATWESTAITAGSARNNVRPVLARDARDMPGAGSAPSAGAGPDADAVPGASAVPDASTVPGTTTVPGASAAAGERSGRQSGSLLLWMHGDYVHFTRYETALKMTTV